MGKHHPEVESWHRYYLQSNWCVGELCTVFLAYAMFYEPFVGTNSFTIDRDKYIETNKSIP